MSSKKRVRVSWIDICSTEIMVDKEELKKYDDIYDYLSHNRDVLYDCEINPYQHVNCKTIDKES